MSTPATGTGRAVSGARCGVGARLGLCGLILWAGAGRAMDGADTLPVRPVAALLSADEASLLRHVNDYRASHGLARWFADAGLRALAQGASEQMVERRRASHDGFQRRFECSGGRLCVEVIAQGRLAPEQAVSLWRQSPAHHRNLIEPRAAWVGVASVDGYTTVLACDAPGR